MLLIPVMGGFVPKMVLVDSGILGMSDARRLRDKMISQLDWDLTEHTPHGLCAKTAEANPHPRLHVDSCHLALPRFLGAFLPSYTLLRGLPSSSCCVLATGPHLPHLVTPCLIWVCHRWHPSICASRGDGHSTQRHTTGTDRL